MEPDSPLAPRYHKVRFKRRGLFPLRHLNEVARFFPCMLSTSENQALWFSAPCKLQWTRQTSNTLIIITCIVVPCRSPSLDQSHIVVDTAQTHFIAYIHAVYPGEADVVQSLGHQTHPALTPSLYWLTMWQWTRHLTSLSQFSCMKSWPHWNQWQTSPGAKSHPLSVRAQEMELHKDG